MTTTTIKRPRYVRVEKALVPGGDAPTVHEATAEAFRRGLFDGVHGIDEAVWRAVDEYEGLRLIATSWWARYKGQGGNWHRSTAVLAGRDDAGLWAIRVPASCSTVAAALRWTVPADAWNRINHGADFRRQGDLLLVRPSRGGWYLHGYGPVTLPLTLHRHRIDERADGTAGITHPEHRYTRLPAGPWRIYWLRQDSGDRTRRD